MVEISRTSIGANVFFRFVKLPSGKQFIRLSFLIQFILSIFMPDIANIGARFRIELKNRKYRCTFLNIIIKKASEE